MEYDGGTAFLVRLSVPRIPGFRSPMVGSEPVISFKEFICSPRPAQMSGAESI